MLEVTRNKQCFVVSFGVFKNTVLSCESDFDVILGVGYGAASVCPQQPIVTVSALGECLLDCYCWVTGFSDNKGWTCP